MRNHQRGEPDRVTSVLAAVTAVILSAILFAACASGLAEFLYTLLTLLTS